MRKRTQGREVALQVLYQVDLRGREALEDLDEQLEREAPGDKEVHAFALGLVEGTLAQQASLDELITAAARNWRLRRMAVIDRNILRMALFEMLHQPDIPAKVSINEAIELGKRFSTKQSGSFINGILDRIRREKEV